MSKSEDQFDEQFYKSGEKYWENVEPTVNGMLGGFPGVTSVDVKASHRFLSQYFMDLEKTKTLMNSKQTTTTTRALDCGAGIGRVTKHLLMKFFDTVDLLEQNSKFLNQSKEHLGPVLSKRIGSLINSSLQDFTPEPDVQYDCIWVQWVIGFVKDEDFVRFLVRCKSALKEPNGMIVIKDNITSSGETDVDHLDGSVTRPLNKLLEIFEKANLTVICERKQHRMPKGLYPVKMFALKPSVQ